MIKYYNLLKIGWNKLVNRIPELFPFMHSNHCLNIDRYEHRFCFFGEGAKGYPVLTGIDVMGYGE
tara:strand:+ start:6637 stop:6831 length:195 start_codon:yes stop_codon:yes gene_type:complete